jgi:hypothetical protein
MPSIKLQPVNLVAESFDMDSCFPIMEQLHLHFFGGSCV